MSGFSNLMRRTKILPSICASNYIGGHHRWGDSRSCQVPRSQYWISSQLKWNIDCWFERGPMKTEPRKSKWTTVFAEMYVQLVVAPSDVGGRAFHRKMEEWHLILCDRNGIDEKGAANTPCAVCHLHTIESASSVRACSQVRVEQNL